MFRAISTVSSQRPNTFYTNLELFEDKHFTIINNGKFCFNNFSERSRNELATITQLINKQYKTNYTAHKAEGIEYDGSINWMWIGFPSKQQMNDVDNWYIIHYMNDSTSCYNILSAHDYYTNDDEEYSQ